MHTKTIAQMSADLTRGDYTSVELTSHFLDRIAQYDGALNSMVTVTKDQALAQAAAADARRQAGDATPLTGIPLCAQRHFLYRWGENHLWFKNVRQLYFAI